MDVNTRIGILHRRAIMIGFAAHLQKCGVKTMQALDAWVRQLDIDLSEDGQNEEVPTDPTNPA